MSDTSKEGILALSGSLMGLSSLTVGFRFWSRMRHNEKIMADDWFAVAAVLSLIGASICVFTMVSNKLLGYSSHDFTPEQIEERGRTNAISEITLDLLGHFTSAFVKLSILFFYRRVFCIGKMRPMFGTFGVITWITIVVVSLWVIVFQFLTGFQCGATHFSALWDGTYIQYCTISFPFVYGLGISDFLLDMWILALPIPGIMRLSTTTKRKVAIITVFLFAFVSMAASIARMVQYIKVERGGPSYLLNSDHEALLTQAYFYTMLECGMASIAVNLPALHLLSISLKPRDIFRGMRSTSDESPSNRRSCDGTEKTASKAVHDDDSAQEKGSAFDVAQHEC